MPESTITVLVVDSDDKHRHRTINELSKYDRLQVEAAISVEEATKVLDVADIDCIVSRRRLNDGTAMDIFKYATEKKSEIGRIFMTEEEPIPLVLKATAIAFGHVDLAGNRPYEKLADMIIDGYDNNRFAPYPVPFDEDERLDTVEKYRDKVTSRFRELVDEAAEDFDVEKASIRLITREKQEYIACHGFIANTLDRDNAICTYTIMDDNVTVINHVQDHPLFEDVAIFKAMDIDWYAGAVLQLEGQNIGTFCLEDSEQQIFTEEDKSRLKDYASRAAALFALQEALEDPSIRTIEEAVGRAQAKA